MTEVIRQLEIRNGILYIQGEEQKCFFNCKAVCQDWCPFFGKSRFAFDENIQAKVYGRSECPIGHIIYLAFRPDKRNQ
jgi:hypothetical protein